jgi:hypothetical protein
MAAGGTPMRPALAMVGTTMVGPMPAAGKPPIAPLPAPPQAHIGMPLRPHISLPRAPFPQMQSLPTAQAVRLGVDVPTLSGLHANMLAATRRAPTGQLISNFVIGAPR